MTANPLLSTDTRSTSINRLYDLYLQIADEQRKEWLTILNYWTSQCKACGEATTAVTKEKKVTQSALEKARASKALVSAELAALKAASKRLNVYTKSISAIDKVLNKPAK